MASPSDIPGFDKLAKLEGFDTKALKGADKADQEVCNFILALALACNDMKDLLWAYSNLRAHTPGVIEISPQYGQLQGMIGHVIRLMYVMVYELARLIHENPAPQAHPEFKKALAHLNAKNRQHWEALQQFADGHPTTDELMKVLVVVRDSLGAHYYMPKMLARGYEKYFSKGGPGRDEGYVSRGMNLEATRFYFADAAANGVSEVLSEGRSKTEIADKLGELSRAM